MKRMRHGTDFAARWVQVGVATAWLAVAGIPVAAQSQGNTPAKPPRSSSPKEKEDPLASLLKQANDAIDKMDFAAAVDPLQKYIAERPDEPYPHFQLGYAYAGLKRADDAKQEFSRAIALDPKMAAAYQNLGLVLIDSDPAAAAGAFLHASELQPSESRPRFFAGFSLEHAGKLPEAIQQYRAALAIAPNDYESHFALGRSLLRSNDSAGAEEQFRAAIALRSDAAPARLGLATALAAQAKYEAASDAFADYLKLNPADRSAHFDRASALLNLNRFDEALAELDRSDAGGAPSGDGLKMRGEIYIQQKKWKEAADALKQAISMSPQDADLAEWIGHVEIELRDYPSAVRILEEAYTRNPQSVGALRDLSDAFYLNENYAAALDAMNRLAKLETPKPGSWFVRAICYDKLSRKAEAIEAYQKFLDQDDGQHDTQDFQARHRILVLQRELGQSKKK
ncbi:MAG TPA: tetratricopeptide repeat protein [Candidatus Acidoferrales bacterium]|jgi:superkiller protein 3|nr:tetratricopeptide repeat protein [Candidatus Acidoferrales bacterium]